MIKMKFLILLIAALFSNAFPQWQQTNGPYGCGAISCMAVSGTNIFAGTDYGVFLSTDNGTSWNVVNAGLANRYVTALAVNGTNVFAGTRGGGIYLSTDNGSSWAPASKGLYLDAGTTISALTVSGTTIIAACWDIGGVYLSTNNGLKWNAVTNTFPYNAILYSFAVNGKNIFAASDYGLYLSTNTGVSWSNISGGQKIACRSVAVNGAYIIIMGDSAGVFRSSNNGASWTSANSGLPEGSYISTFAVCDSIVYSGIWGKGLFRSTDNGENWNSISVELTCPFISSLEVNNKYIMVGTEDGVFCSTNNGTEWISTNSGFSANSDVSVITEIDSTIFAGTNGGVYKSTDDGANWVPANNGFRPYMEVFDIIKSRTNLFAGTSAGVYLSATNNVKWAPVNSDLTDKFVYSIFVNDSSLFASTFGGFFQCTKSGGNWNAVKSGFPADVIVNDFISLGTTIFAGTSGKGILISTDNGVGWVAANNGFPERDAVEQFAVCGTSIFAASQQSVYVSTNGGISWSAISSALKNKMISSIASKDGNIFAGTNYGVFLSTNNGASWANDNEGLAGLNVSTLLIRSGKIFAGIKKGGVWVRPLSELITTVDHKTNKLPPNFSMEQNFPNPFNPSTKIEYTMPTASKTRMNIYSVTGELVSTLVDGFQSAGAHTATFNGEGLPSGLYICRISAGGFVQSRKMLLLK